MNKKYKIHGKAIKWINSRFSKKEKARRSLRIVMRAQIQAATAVQINTIKRASKGEINTALAIARTVLAGQIAISKVLGIRGVEL